MTEPFIARRPATEQARRLFRSLSTPRSTLSGQHNFPNHRSRHSDEVARITGKYPAVWGSDFGFSGGDDKDSVLARQAIVDEAIRQHAAGSAVTLMWHAVRPTEDEPVTFAESIQGKITDAEWRDLITPGTAIHTRWCAQVDTIAAFLAQLRDADVPVIWRPYHEMNGGWFWWGGRPGPDGYAALYRMLYDRLMRVHKLDNLLWVYNTDRPSRTVLPLDACFPGHDVVDMLAIDIYDGDYDPKYYNGLRRLAEGKPVAIGECGTAPIPAILEAQPEWSWFMIWAGMHKTHNTPAALRALYSSPRVASVIPANETAPDPQPTRR